MMARFMPFPRTEWDAERLDLHGVLLLFCADGGLKSYRENGIMAKR